MKNKKIKIKNLATPTIILFMHGFIDGRFKFAKISNDNGLLNSSYINGKVNLFYKYCNERINLLEMDIADICIEAEKLIMELESIHTIMINTYKVPTSNNIEFSKIMPTSLVEAKIARDIAITNEKANKLEEKKNQIRKRKIYILNRLTEIKSCILNSEIQCRNELISTTLALKERIVVYIHGVILGPALDSYIPKIEYNMVFNNLYNENYGEIIQRISNILKKEENKNV